MADYFVTLSTSGTAQPSLRRLPTKVLSSVGASVPKLLKRPQIVKAISGVSAPVIVKSVLRSFTTSGLAAVNAVYNMIRPRTAPIAILDSRWVGSLDIDSIADLGLGYSATLEGPITGG